MPTVGPSCSGKNELMFHMLQENSFFTRLEKIFLLLQGVPTTVQRKAC